MSWAGESERKERAQTLCYFDDVPQFLVWHREHVCDSRDTKGVSRCFHPRLISVSPAFWSEMLRKWPGNKFSRPIWCGLFWHQVQWQMQSLCSTKYMTLPNQVFSFTCFKSKPVPINSGCGGQSGQEEASLLPWAAASSVAARSHPNTSASPTESPEASPDSHPHFQNTEQHRNFLCSCYKYSEK